MKLDFGVFETIESNFGSFHMGKSKINQILNNGEDDSPGSCWKQAILLQAVFLKHVKEFWQIKRVKCDF